MTNEEAKAEWRYRVEERLGCLCGGNVPTTEQGALAVKEANEAILAIQDKGGDVE